MKINFGKINFVILVVVTILAMIICGVWFTLGIYVTDDVLTRFVGAGWSKTIIISVSVFLIALTGLWTVHFRKEENDNKDE